MRRGVLLGLVLAVVAVALARRRLDAVAVRGRSMEPSLLPGDRLLVVGSGRRPRPGEVVLSPDPRDGRRELVKRVARVRGDRVWLASDSALGRSLVVDAAGVRWRAAARYWPPRRAGRIPAGLPVVDEGGEAACAAPEALIAGEWAGPVRRARSRPAATRPPIG